MKLNVNRVSEVWHGVWIYIIRTTMALICHLSKWKIELIGRTKR